MCEVIGRDEIVVSKIGTQDNSVDMMTKSLHIKDKNIGFDGYINTWILRIYQIYRRHISRYFYINIHKTQII